MRQQVRVAVIIPAGPRDDVFDTLHSVVHYADASRVIVVMDDTATGLDSSKVQRLSADIALLRPPPRAEGFLGGLWVKLATAYTWVLDRYAPAMVLRLDADALVIGRGLEDAVEAAFAAQPGVGLLGSYQIRWDGQLRDTSWAARRLRTEVGIRGLRYPKRRKNMRQHLSAARSNGYIDGESTLGGAYIHNLAAVTRIHANGWFDQPWLASSRLGEDHLMSMLTVAAGYRIADFGGPGDPMALSWQGMPAHPYDLLQQGKLVTHSVRYWRDMNECAIREIFAEVRRADGAVRQSDDARLS